MSFDGAIMASTPYRAAALLLLWLVTFHCQAGEGPRSLYLEGIHLYRQADYHDARTVLEEAVKQAPGIATYHHWLGRVYGRLAERAGPFSAIALSRKTLEQLRTAVELDDRNVAAIKDLIEYYRRAPAFLGGSRRKAEELAARVKQLEASDISRQGSVRTTTEPPS